LKSKLSFFIFEKFFRKRALPLEWILLQKVTEVYVKWILAIMIFLPTLSSLADEKCPEREEIEASYQSIKIQYVTNHGHLLAINTTPYSQKQGHLIDVYAAKLQPVKRKGTTEISHYKTCLLPVKKQVLGQYIYGSLTKYGVDIKTDKNVQRISFVKH
jgi:hypothetical protein